MLLQKEMSWTPLAFVTSEAWLGTHFSATETFSANSDDVSVWALGGLLADVNVTLRDALEGSVADNPSTQRKRLAPTVMKFSSGGS